MTEALPADWQSTSDTNPAAAIEQAVVANVVGTAVGNALSSQPWLGAALAKVKEQAATLGLNQGC
jgi:hypothetical protein